MRSIKLNKPYENTTSPKTQFASHHPDSAITTAVVNTSEEEDG